MASKRTYDIDGVPLTVEEGCRLGRFSQGYAIGGDYRRNRIRVSRGVPSGTRRAVLLEELLHHLWERAGLHEALSTRTEELVLSELAGWLVTAAGTAPDLFRDIFDLEEGD